MAKAQLVQEEKLISTYTLTLTEYEAKVLAFVTRKIGGSPHVTPRAVFDRISAVLDAVGLNRFDVEFASEGEIKFLTPEETKEQEQVYGGPFIEDDPDYESPDYSDYEY